MQTGQEYKGSWGDIKLVLRAIKLINKVYIIDDLLFVEELPLDKFLNEYKPTGRVNKALKNLFKDYNFSEGRNERKNFTRRKNFTPYKKI